MQAMGPTSKTEDPGKAPFDRASLWERVNEDMELLRDLLQIFKQESPVMLQKLQAALEQKSFPDVAKFSHKLKGSALQFSASPAAATAARLEKMGQSHVLEGSAEAFEQLKNEITDLVEALRQMIQSKGPRT
jgi:HPt (histidine-containing phosphotransfer) domain-containing protein